MGVHIELQGLLVLDMRMLFMIALAFLPALVIGEEEKTAAANFQAVCDFYAKEIEILEKNKKELKDLVKLESVLYEKLNSSSGICNAIGYLALPDCALKEEGPKKQRVNVFDRLDDKCAEDKTNKITKSLKTVLGLGTEPLGQVVFRSCKDIFVKIILEQFKKMQGFISSQCDQSLSTGPASRSKRSYGGGYYPVGYDPSTIWFQYLLCHEQKISCYFFTQGWNEKEFGQYYLYENLFDTGFDKLGHASSGTDDLLFLALLGGLGGSHQYPHQAYPSYKKRRHVEDEEDHAVNSDGRRRRATTADPDESSSSKTRRRRATADPEETSSSKTSSSNGRRRRATADPDESSSSKSSSSNGRRRRATTADPVESCSSKSSSSN